MVRWLRILVLCLLIPTLGYADPASHANPNMQRQLQQWFGDYSTSWVQAGCLPTVPSASLILAAFACEAYSKDGTTGELWYIAQPAVSVTMAATAGVSWLAIHRDTTSTVSSWTRVAATHYLLQHVTAKPADPSGAQVVAQITVAANIVTAVADVRRPASWARAGVYDVTDPLYGAVGDDSTADTVAFQRALAAGAGHRVFVPNPRVAYKITASLTVPAATQLVGAGKRSSKIHHAFHGLLFTLQTGAALESLWLEGDGATFTGGAMALTGSDGHQNIEHVQAVNFQGPILDIATLAGSQMSVMDFDMNRWDIGTAAPATTGSALYAVVIADAQQLAALPRKFVNIESNGSPAFSFGGSNGTFVTNAFVGDMLFGVESRGVHLVNIRWANQATAHLLGHNNSLTGSGIGPQLVLDSGTDGWGIDCSNDLNIPPIVDNSGTKGSRLCYGATLFTSQVTWSSSAGTAPALGNADVRATYSQIGTRVHLMYEVTFGSTSTYGSAGAWYFNAPFPYIALTGFPQVQTGSGYLRRDSTGDIALIVPQIISGTNQIYLNLSGGSQATYNAPWAWATSDIVRFSIDYDR